MVKKDDYLSKIDRIPTVSFNKEQKIIAKKILEKTDEKDLDAVYGLITQRVKTGFVFDEAPEVNHNAVAIVKENKELRIDGDSLDCIEHKLIIGENYDALKNLCATYIDKNGKGLIDVIYIDPPYNTEASKDDGNDYKQEFEATKFIYRDKFTRDGWLNMMNERLNFAKQLLSDNGVIFISIDDSEQAYLKVLCDEIFGEENFLIDLIRKTKSTTNDAKTGVNIQHENCLCYAKNYNKVKLFGEEKDLSHYSNLDNDPNGEWCSSDPSAKSGSKETGWFPIKNPYTGKIDYPPKGRFWLFSQNTLQKYIDYGTICFKKEHKENERGFIYKRYKKDLLTTKKTLDSLVFCENEYMNQSATKMLLSLGMVDSFKYPKGVNFIKKLLLHSTSKNSIILDFFAGSGTTGQAVIELNAEDGGNRQFILVTNNENNIGEKITRERLYRVIKGVGTNGETFDWTYKKDTPYLNKNSVRVFNIETHELTLNDLDKAEDLKEMAKLEFKKLNKNYSINNDFDIYNELSALNPQKLDKDCK